MPYNFKPPDIFEEISSPLVMMASVVQDVEQPAYKSRGSWFDLVVGWWFTSNILNCNLTVISPLTLQHINIEHINSFYSNYGGRGALIMTATMERTLYLLLKNWNPFRVCNSVIGTVTDLKVGVKRVKQHWMYTLWLLDTWLYFVNLARLDPF